MKGKIFAVIVIILALLAAIWRFGIVLYDKGSQNAEDLNITNVDELNDDEDLDKPSEEDSKEPTTSDDDKNLTESNYDEKISSRSEVVIVDFYADWCAPCKKLSPILEEIEGENKDKYKVYRVDTDIETGLGTRFGIRYLPTLLIYKDGVMIDSLIGFMSKEELLSRLNKLNI